MTPNVIGNKVMTPSTKKLLEQVESWPQQDQEELAEFAREIEARRTGVYHATSDELAAIDEALGQIARGEIAGKDEVEAAFAKFRGA
jgi:pyruvate/2-oxoacid:ferredoxin oxidoreductase alpha subunit